VISSNSQSSFILGVIGVSAESDSSVTLAMQRADANGCPFYCMKIVISLVKGEL
jgi:hypothetical protein